MWGTGCGGMVTTDGCSMRCVKDNYPSIFIRHVLLGDSSETKDLDVFLLNLSPPEPHFRNELFLTMLSGCCG